MEIVRFDQVSLNVCGRTLMDQVSFSMFLGEHIGIIGPSGAGKSTFLKLMLGFLKPSKGKVYLFGQAVSELSDQDLEKLRMDIGMLFQTDALFSEWTVEENIAFPIRYHYDLPEQVTRNLVKLKLDDVGLRGAERLFPRELSGGMARRVALARAVSRDPNFIIYDEPFTGQDPVTKSHLKILMRKFHKEKMSSVIVSHDIKDLSEVVQKMVVIWEGRVMAFGTVDEVMKSDNEVVRHFIDGSSLLTQENSDQDLLTDIMEGC
jgi:phospholipid/cholesterol/gamma-HCH transport system ATP-binding protein